MKKVQRFNINNNDLLFEIIIRKTERVMHKKE